MNRKQRRAGSKRGGGAPGAPPPVANGVVELFAAGMRFHQAGRLDQAEACYRQVLAVDRRHADSLHLLGVIADQCGRPDAAIDLIGRAIAANRRFPDFHNSLGIALQAAGRPAEAIRAFGQAVRLKADYLEALVNLANALRGQGALAAAAGRFGQVLALRPDFAEMHYNLGNTERDRGRSAAAARCYGRAAALRPDYAEAYTNLGNVLRAAGDLEAAVAIYQQGLSQRGDFPQLFTNLGVALFELGRPAEAEARFRQALDLAPDLAEAHGNLGNVLQGGGNSGAAIAAYRRALALKPDLADAWNGLAGTWESQADWQAATVACRRALLIRPDHVEALYNLGNIRRGQGKLGPAAVSYRHALALAPARGDAWTNLGNSLVDQGALAAGAVALERAVAAWPDYPLAHSALLMALHYASDTDNALLLHKARRFARRFEPSRAPHLFGNRTDVARRLKIGYVSADLRDHPVGTFLARVLPAHDAAAVELFCYANGEADDPVAALLRKAADHWRPIAQLTDDQAAELVREDGIDILVDLSGHSSGHRLGLFALRAAPVQVTWLGYFGTTGLDSIDYVLADRVVVPEGEEPFFSEAVWRLPGCYLCYAPRAETIPVGPPPALANGCITFGCFNRRPKLADATIALWAELLSRLPDSRLLLKTMSLADDGVRQGLVEAFRRRGIATERLILEPHAPVAEALAAYGRVDIALDSFPFGGGTTTADTLWMGVPLVSLAGSRWSGRMSQSILAGLGLQDWVAATPAAYVDLAAGLAADLPRLAELRASLRPRLEGSAFCDGAAFARKLEAAYRGMWEKWCGDTA